MLALCAALAAGLFVCLLVALWPRLSYAAWRKLHQLLALSALVGAAHLVLLGLDGVLLVVPVLILALALKLGGNSPFFTQDRVGLGGERFKFYKLTLDDVKTGNKLQSYDPSDESAEFMRKAKDETEDLDDSPKWPTGLDPIKRESIAVMRDLVELSESARVAGLIE